MNLKNQKFFEKIYEKSIIRKGYNEDVNIVAFFCLHKKGGEI